MKRITWYNNNSNGVSMYKSEYIGKGIYDARISAENIEVSDIFCRMGVEVEVIEIKDQFESKSTDKSLTVYDCSLKDNSWTNESGYIQRLPVLHIPIADDFDIEPK